MFLFFRTWSNVSSLHRRNNCTICFINYTALSMNWVNDSNDKNTMYVTRKHVQSSERECFSLDGRINGTCSPNWERVSRSAMIGAFHSCKFISFFQKSENTQIQHCSHWSWRWYVSIRDWLVSGKHKLGVCLWTISVSLVPVTWQSKHRWVTDLRFCSMAVLWVSSKKSRSSVDTNVVCDQWMSFSVQRITRSTSI